MQSSQSYKLGSYIQYEKYFQIILDIIILVTALLISYFIRYDFIPTQESIDQFLHIAPWVCIIQVFFFYLLGLYRSIWRYSGPSDLLLIFKATTIVFFLVMLGQVCIRTYLESPLLIQIFSSWLNPLMQILFIGFTIENLVTPFPVIILYWILSAVFVSGERLLARYWVELKRREQSSKLYRLLVVGGGNETEAVLRELRRNPGLPYQPVGIIDENIKRTGFQIHGIKILGTIKDIPEIIKEYKIDEIIIALPSHSGKIVRDIITLCEPYKIKIRSLPSMEDLFVGRIRINQFPEIQPEDLLGRKQMDIDSREVAEYLENRIILVTGAGGSIGSELCRQVSQYKPKSLILVGSGENSIYEIEVELRHLYPHLDIQPVICNIQDKNRVEQVFKKYKPQVVFHAAAHKHVPMMELNPGEAIKNNIWGTYHVAQSAIDINADRFIFISTDKAIHPNSVMGISKRIAELVVEFLAANSSTRFAIVRFGNVLGSRGSVIPMFQKQIIWGGPVTVTHPDATRYFMSISEAVRLVIQTGVMGQKGEIYALNMGEPIKIVDLARNLITLSGLDPENDIPIKYTGLRPGEKLTEESVTMGEGINQTRYTGIFQTTSDKINPAEFKNQLDHLRNLNIQDISSKELFTELSRVLSNILKNQQDQK